MRFTLIAVVAFFVVNAVADDHMREVKTANPLIEIHPKAVQPAADVYYKAVEEKVFNGAIPLKYAQLAALSASVAMKCEYCIPAHLLWNLFGLSQCARHYGDCNRNGC